MVRGRRGRGLYNYKSVGSKWVVFISLPAPGLPQAHGYLPPFPPKWGTSWLSKQVDSIPGENWLFKGTGEFRVRLCPSAFRTNSRLY